MSWRNICQSQPNEQLFRGPHWTMNDCVAFSVHRLSPMVLSIDEICVSVVISWNVEVSIQFYAILVWAVVYDRSTMRCKCSAWSYTLCVTPSIMWPAEIESQINKILVGIRAICVSLCVEAKTFNWCWGVWKKSNTLSLRGANVFHLFWNFSVAVAVVVADNGISISQVDGEGDGR